MKAYIFVVAKNVNVKRRGKPFLWTTVSIPTRSLRKTIDRPLSSLGTGFTKREKGKHSSGGTHIPEKAVTLRI